jgi:hypothetical protein
MRTAILPFLFIFNTQLLLIGIDSTWHLVLTVVSATVAMLVFAAATQGWFLVRTRWYETVALLLVTFTLFRPGFWWDMAFPPYEEAPATELMRYAETAPRNANKRIWIEGQTLEGRDVRKGVLLPLGEPGTARERLAQAGLRVVPMGEELQITMVQFGSQAQKLGLEQGWRITAIEMPADRPAKEWMFVPALALLGLVVWLQRRRARQEPPPAPKGAAATA